MAKKKSSEDKVKDFLEKAQKRLKWEVKADQHNRDAALECLNFLLPGGQWTAAQKADRKDRPCIEINLLNKYIEQIVGEMLHNRARVDLKPADMSASPHIANIRRGIITDTEYRSNSEDIYLEAGKMLVSSGYGAWRTNTRYCEENPFEQEMYDELIPNPFAVYLDSRRKDAAGADAQYGFILCKMPTDEFKEAYPDADVPYDSIGGKGQGIANELWYADDTTTVAEYFVIDHKDQKMCQMENGDVLTEEEYRDRLQEWEEKQQEKIATIPKMLEAAMSPTPVPAVQMPPQAQPAPGAMPPMGDTPMPQAGALPTPPTMPPPSLPPEPVEPKPKVVKRRTTKIKIVKHYTITATEILTKKKEFDDEEVDPLEGETFPGKYIPITLITGPSVNVAGKVFINGLVRPAMDAQRLVNYWESALAELIALAPKSPWVATAEQIEGNEEAYRTANVKNYPVLLYKPHDHNGQLLPPPMRQGPGEPPIALFQQVSRAHENVKQVMGMFGADVGEVGPERTGAAVWAKQTPGDIGKYIFAYNLNRAIEHSGKIKNEIIPELYDTERDARLRNIDDTEVIVPINTTAEAAHKSITSNPQRYKGMNTTQLAKMLQTGKKNEKFNDITQGKYDVVITVGPSYATQRQKTAIVLQNMMQTMPKETGKVIDILFENLDFKDADKCASRFRRMMPAGLTRLKEGEMPFKSPMPPQIQALMQKGKTEQAKEQVQLLKAKVEMVKLYKELKETDHDIKKQVLAILGELHAPDGAHPADVLLEGEG
jgi:hypothetical protein